MKNQFQIATIFRLMVLMLLTITLACSSDDDNKSCETNDTGTFKATIPNSNNETEFLFTMTGNPTPVSVIVAPNKTSMSKNLPTGNYVVSVAQINDDGQAVTDAVNLNITIEQCEETTRTVTFD